MGVAERDPFARPLIPEWFILMMSRLAGSVFGLSPPVKGCGPVPGQPVGPLQGGSRDAIQSEKRCRTPNASWQLARSDASRGRPRHRRIGKDGWRTSKANRVACEFGHNNAARNPSPEHDQSKQGYRSNPRLAENVGKSS